MQPLDFRATPPPADCPLPTANTPLSWRHDPLSGHTVRIAAGRAERPNDFQEAAGERRCPFCAGSEADTPAELDRVAASDGVWLARVVPNRYPIVTGDDGAHEVVIESSRHVRRFVDLTDTEAVAATRLWARRIDHHRANPAFDYALLFKNEGPAAGASLEHVHSQVVALPEPPAGSRRVVLSDAEPVIGVATREGLRVSVPPAPRFANETWIGPTRPTPLAEVSVPLASVLRAVLRALDPPAFNLVLRLAEDAWRLEIVPRTSAIAGFELATGAYINAVSPEESARRLRDRLG